MNLINQALATRLKATRRLRGHSLEDVVNELGTIKKINKATVSRYERGECLIPAWVLVAYNMLELKNE